jgi:LysR family transcriptional regulator, benzoate and cis,cis-muconate-responsive activator of ben and cat genes
LGVDEIDVRHLRYALAVAETGAFTRAAAVLNLEPSALSRGVRDLEDRLGVDIFDRLPRGVRATLAGASFLARARDIVARLERAQAEARCAGLGRHGQLRLGFVWSVARGPGAKLLRAFASANPAIELMLREGHPHALMTMLNEGALDAVLTIAFHRGRPVPSEAQLFEQLAIWEEPLFVMVPVFEASEAISWAHLSGRVLLCRIDEAAPELTTHLANLGEPAPRFERVDTSAEGLLALVAANVGWALAPQQMVRTEPEVRFVPIVAPGACLQAVAVWRPEHSNPALTRFLALARDRYGSREN